MIIIHTASRQVESKRCVDISHAEREAVMAQRKHYGGPFKTQVVMEATAGCGTVNEIAWTYGASSAGGQVEGAGVGASGGGLVGRTRGQGHPGLG